LADVHLDYVFDFELEEAPETVVSEPPKHDMIEANLSRTLAADAPSHRSAWKTSRGHVSMLSALRRETSETEEEPGPEAATFSKLATSVPVNISMPRKKAQPSILPMERKTSLSDKGDILVPSLIAAMRQRGVASGQVEDGAQSPRVSRFDPRHPTQQERRRSRSASITREREGARSYAADPGAVFETLADEDEETQEEGEDEGTLREERFVPPHIVVRREDRQAGAEVGWRSLVNG
jgi:hypothetical protein